MTELSQKEFDIISIVASRKAEFYLNTKTKLKELLAKLSPALSIDEEDADLRLRKAISELDNMLFISEEEKTSNTIDPSLSVSQLKLNSKEIQERIVRAMTEN